MSMMSASWSIVASTSFTWLGVISSV